MATIHNTLKKPNGDPIRGADVTVELSWDISTSPFAMHESATPSYIVDGVAYTETDVDGYWEMEVISNEDIFPANSVYRITEEVSSTDTNSYYVSVPVEGATPIYWVGNNLAATPAWEA